MKNAALAFITISLMCIAFPAHAEKKFKSYRLNFSLGYYDVFDAQDGFDLRAEYRSNSIVFIKNLKPWTGLEITSEGSVWAGGGLLYDWQFIENWYLTPSLGLGLYNNGGDDKDLDHFLQFRTQLEIAYEFENKNRVGLGLSHTSNAGLGDDNPGTEVVSLNWSIPF